MAIIFHPSMALSILQLPSSVLIIAFLISIFTIMKQRKRNEAKNVTTSKLPPGPKRLPLIGNLHQMIGSLPHHVLTDLAKKHGPIMHLQLGEVLAIVISSPDIAKEILKDHELSFAQRPKVTALDIVSYENSSFIFSPYGEYWRQMRKIMVLELLSNKRVMSFRLIREQEAWNLIRNIYSFAGQKIDLSQMILSLINDMTSRAAFGERCKYQEEFISFIKEATTIAGGFELTDFFPSIRILRLTSRSKPTWERLHRKVDTILNQIIEDHLLKMKTTNDTDNNETREDLVDVLLNLQKSKDELKTIMRMDVVKNVIMEVFSAGTDTSSTTIEWAMSELLKNPKVMQKAQSEVRSVLKGKAKVHESDIENLPYLKNVVKETLRLHPPGPLMAREARENCKINGYEIPFKAKIIINTWAIGRDSNNWLNAEMFMPERFEDSLLDYRGGNFGYIPFGGGRRICPGISFGIANIELPLALLLYHFDWSFPDGIKPEDLEMTETFGITARRMNNLVLIPTPYIALSKDETE